MYSINTLYHLTFININMIGILLTIQRFKKGNQLNILLCFNILHCLPIKEKPQLKLVFF